MTMKVLATIILSLLVTIGEAGSRTEPCREITCEEARNRDTWCVRTKRINRFGATYREVCKKPGFVEPNPKRWKKQRCDPECIPS